ncbi:MAG TPA: hypothetical protein VGO50_01160 [Pyrinomonadaceae bacterium]|jgi:hypothetical protein|nr:hypothetical protein [Pyrinomonadaceae bacterium]
MKEKLNSDHSNDWKEAWRRIFNENILIKLGAYLLPPDERSSGFFWFCPSARDRPVVVGLSLVVN